MERNDLKKILAGFSIAGLLTGAVLTAPGCATKGQTSCSGTKQEGMKTSCSGSKTEGAKTSCSGAKTSCS